MNLNRPMGTAKSAWKRPFRFSLGFCALTVVFAVVFTRYSEAAAWLYLMPISFAATSLLQLAGIELALDTTHLSSGFCELWVGPTNYTISLACTGIFTCSLFIAACLAYPATARDKLVALALGVPAFVTFGTLRIIIMVIVVLTAPSRIEVFHLYIMSIANLGFALFIWVYWINGVSEAADTGDLSG